MKDSVIPGEFGGVMGSAVRGHGAITVPPSRRFVSKQSRACFSLAPAADPRTSALVWIRLHKFAATWRAGGTRGGRGFKGAARGCSADACLPALCSAPPCPPSPAPRTRRCLPGEEQVDDALAAPPAAGAVSHRAGLPLAQTGAAVTLSPAGALLLAAGTRAVPSVQPEPAAFRHHLHTMGSVNGNGWGGAGGGRAAGERGGCWGVRGQDGDDEHPRGRMRMLSILGAGWGH